MMESNNSSNSGSGEREHFNSIASRYVKKDIFSPSRIARKLRIKQTISGISVSDSMDILEVGCGAGYVSEYLKGLYSTYTGIDFSGRLIDLARSIHNVPCVEFYETDLYEYAPGRKFDLIVLIGVLHHMADIPLSLTMCKKLLKPGGILIVNEPQDANILIRFMRKLRSKFDKTYSSDQEELNRKNLVKLFDQAGFGDIYMKPQGFFSTPFAEVMMKPAFIFLPLSHISCFIDRMFEKTFGKLLVKLSWNVIVTGNNPDC